MEKIKFNDALKVFNPFQYKNFLRHKQKYIIYIYLIFLIVSLILFAIVLMPKTFYLKHNVKNAINSFDNLSIDITANHEQRLFIANNPEIVVDLNNDSNIQGNIMITKDNLFIKMWPFEKQSNLNDFSNLRDRSDSLSKLIALLGLLIFPGIIITIGLFYVIESLILAAIFSLIGFVIIRIFKRDLMLKRILKIAIVSSVILLLFNSVFIPTILNAWFPIIIYFLFFILATFICSNKLGFSSTEKPIKGRDKKISRTKQIFGKPKIKKDNDDFIMLE